LTDDPSAILLTVRLALRGLGFTPMVFKKIRKDQKAKGVDIALTKDMLMEAVRDRYDIAILVAADGDYVPVLDEVQRLGKMVIVAFWDGDWVSDELRWRADHFVDLTDALHGALKNCEESCGRINSGATKSKRAIAGRQPNSSERGLLES
jgi:uncharacterized LabA/DUF88 family protein